MRRLNVMIKNNSKIIREAQELTREGWFERSVYQAGEPMNKNIIGGACRGMRGPRILKSCELSVCVNDAVVSAKRINLSREICSSG